MSNAVMLLLLTVISILCGITLLVVARAVLQAIDNHEKQQQSDSQDDILN